MRFRIFPALVVVLVSARAEAESLPSGAPSSDRTVSDTAAPERAVARVHFESALALYRAGKYRRAVAELQAALDRDPTGKDLVYNLALVEEKLGDFAGAIQSLQRFQSMETDPVELERAAQTLQRLEGARVELTPVLPPARPIAPIPCPIRPTRGRWDGWVIGSGGLAVAALLVGTVFGARALTLDPSGESTGPSVSAADLRSRGDRARAAAAVADVAFATSVLAGAASATLYFGRSSDSGLTAHAFFPAPAPRVTAAWLVLRY